jgi:tRNA U55 pseudouridine synthase TruB
MRETEVAFETQTALSFGEAVERCRHALSLLRKSNTLREFEARCGKGTYVRALARDMGKALGCLGRYLIAVLGHDRG